MDKIRLSKNLSYLLRHDPGDLEMDKNGFVKIDALIDKLQNKFPELDRELLEEAVNKKGKKRYEIKDNKIRALYGHSLDIDLDLEEDKNVGELYHGTRERTAKKILKYGLKTRNRTMTHLSATIEDAKEIGRRRTDDPTILKVDVKTARRDGLKFYKATDRVYLSNGIPPQYIKKI